MNCSPYDLKDYILGELSGEARRQVESHAASCLDCREELDRLSITHAALHALREEEVPRRIAFVSDKVFEPNWWQRLWASGPRLGFASALMLSIAIFVHAFVPRAMAPAPAPVQQIDQARIEAEVGRRVEAAVEKTIAASEERQVKKTAELVAAAERKFDFERKADQVAYEENLKYLQKQMNVRFLASAELGGSR